MDYGIHKGMGEAEIAGSITTKVRRHIDARAQYYRQAFVNVMFLYGKHHFTLSRNNPEPTIGQRIVWELEARRGKGTLRRTSNYILPLFRSVYSRLIRRKGNVSAEATTRQESDRNAAKFSKEVAEDFWDNCNRNNIWMPDDMYGMQAILMKLILYDMTTGMGYLFPYFNPKAKTFVYDPIRKDVIEADVGEAEVRVDHVFNVFPDTYRRYLTNRRRMSVEQAEYEFNAKVDPSPVDEEAYDIKISRIIDGSEFDRLDQDGAYIYTDYITPNKEYPKGKIFHACAGKVIGDEDLPPECRERIPCFEFRYQDLGFSKHGQGAIEQVVDLQQDYNFTLARIGQHKKLLTGKVMAPKKAGLSVQWNDIVGQIINYNRGFKPTMEPAPPIPSYFHDEIKRIRQDMEDVLNAHGSSIGRNPKQVKSGVGIQELNELDNDQIAPELIMYEMKLGFFTEHVLDIAQYRYNERRLLKISGEDMAYEVKSFIGSDLMGRKNVKIKMGSSFPTSQTGRTNYILMLRKEGFISPEKAKSLMEVNDVEGAFHNLDEVGAKNDILNTLEGNAQVMPEPYEDHTIYLKVINDFRKGLVYQKLPVKQRKKIDKLAEGHQQMLLAEMQAAKGVDGGQGLPTPAQPQMQQQQ